MLPARRHPVLEGLLFAYIGRLLRGHLDSLRLGGPGRAVLGAGDDAYPLIVYSNHQTWWDGFLEVPVARRYRARLWLMMEERNLRRFAAFRWTGVFGVDLDSPAGRAAALRYAARRLRDGGPRAVLFLYPHGRLVRPHEAWPPFAGGLEALLRLVPEARAVPVAKELAHGRYQHPEGYLWAGEPRRGTTGDLETGLREAVRDLQAWMGAGATEGAEWLLPPRRRSLGRTG